MLGYSFSPPALRNLLNSSCFLACLIFLLLLFFKLSPFYFPLPCKGPCIATCITTAGFEISHHTESRHLYSYMCSENIYRQLLLRLDSYAIKSLQYPSHVLLLSLAQGKNSATGYIQQRQELCPSAYWSWNGQPIHAITCSHIICCQSCVQNASLQAIPSFPSI